MELLPGEEFGVTPVSPLWPEGMSCAARWLGHPGVLKEGEFNPLGFAFLRDFPSHQQRKNIQTSIPAWIQLQVLAAGIPCCDSTLNPYFPPEFP